MQIEFDSSAAYYSNRYKFLTSELGNFGVVQLSYALQKVLSFHDCVAKLQNIFLTVYTVKLKTTLLQNFCIAIVILIG